MAAIVKHGKFELVFNDDTEVWECDAIGVSNTSLKLAKKQIDRISKKQRSINLPALYLEGGDRYWRASKPALRDCVITTIRTDRSSAKFQIKVSGKSEEVGASEVYPLTARAALERYVAEKTSAIAAEDRAEKAKNSVDHHTPETVREAVTLEAEKDA